MLSTAPTMAFAAAASTSQSTSTQQTTTTTKQFSFDQPLSKLADLTYGNTTQAQADQKNAAAITQIFGDNATSITNVGSITNGASNDSTSANNSKIHFNVTTTTDKTTGDVQIQASGYIQAGGSTKYSITTEQSTLDSVDTSLGTLEKAELPGTLTTPSGKNYNLNVGIAYVPNTDNYQATIVIDGLGYPVSLDFGKGFVTQSISNDIKAYNATKTVIPNNTSSDSTSQAADSVLNAGTQHFLGDDYSTTLDGNVDYFGNNTPTEVMRASNGPSGTQQYIEDEVWGTHQVLNYLGGSTGRSISVSGVNFAVSVPDSNWSLENSFYPAPISPPQFNFSWVSWLIDLIPELGSAASSLVQQIADQNVTVGGGIVNKTPGDAYMNQINWTGVGTDELTGVYHPTASTPAYDEQFFGDPKYGQSVQVDAQVTYENDVYSLGYVEYDSAPWMYMSGTIEAPSS